MSAGMDSVAIFAVSLSGQFLLCLGQALVVVCMCFDLIRALSVPRSRPRFVASTVFRTLALPSILGMGINVLVDAVFWSWTEVALGVFILVMIIFRLHYDTDEDHWWKGKGKALGRWLRNALAPPSMAVPVAA